MDGNSTGGAIAQTFTTVVGNTYVVRFMATTNSSGIATTKGLEMTVGGFSTDFLISTTSASTGASPEWSERTYTFVATSTSTTLQFRSLSTSGTAGAVISDIAVADVTANNGNDTLNGGDNDDTIIGSGGNDIIDGGNGNDLIFGGGGTNTINGGAGTDIVMFSGNRGNYSVTVSGANYIVTDLRTGAPDGTSTITNVETFRFTDGDLTPVQASLRTPIFESFEDSSLTGWTGGAIVSSDTNFSSILTSATSSGSPATNASSLGIVGTQDVFKTFSLSGNQNSVTIAFTFNRIDSWDGENFIVWVNDVAVSTRAYSGNATSNYADTTSDSSSGTNLGYQGTWDEEIVTYVLTVNTSATSLKLGFGSSVDQNWNDEAWGVDNLSIREQITATTTGTYSEGTTAGDTLNGTSLYDSYAGGVGNDTLTGAAGSDYLSGGHGTDSVDGGTGNDIVVGGWGADTLAGGLGSDSMDGGEGADFIYGGGLQILSNTWSSGGNVSSISTQGSTEGANALAFGISNTANTGQVNQTVTTVAGSDYTIGFDYWAWGNTGLSQSMRFRVISGGFTVIDTTISATATTGTFTPIDYVFSYTALGTSTQIQFNDVSSSSTSVDGMLDNIRMFIDDEGADAITGGAGNDFIYGGRGSDTIIGGAGSDSMFADQGTDTLSYVDSTAAVTVNLGTGAASGGYAAVTSFTTSRISPARPLLTR